MNMFKPTKATSVQEYLAQVPQERKDMVLFLHNFIKKTVPRFKPHFANNMIGYGSFPYVNYKKELVQWPVIALANQKQYVSIYVCALEGKEYIAEKHKDQLGKGNVGKSCIRIKNLNDVSLPVLQKMLQAAAKNPGLVAESEKSARVKKSEYKHKK